MVSVTSASRHHPQYQRRSSMYIRGLITRNIAELAEAVPIILENASFRQEQSTMQSLYNKIHVFGAPGINYVISGPCHKGTILQQNFRKMTIHDHFSIIRL